MMPTYPAKWMTMKKFSNCKYKVDINAKKVLVVCQKLSPTQPYPIIRYTSIPSISPKN